MTSLKLFTPSLHRKLALLAGTHLSVLLSALTVVANDNPVVTISSPVSKSRLGALTTISGTAAVSAKGATLREVEIRIRRFIGNRKIGEQWNGKIWQDNSTTTPHVMAKLSAGQWTSRDDLPQGANLRSGTYHIEVVAYDSLGNAGYATSSIELHRGPDPKIVSPVDAQALGILDSIRGVVAAGANGSPVKEVKVQLSRQAVSGASIEYWNGESWVNDRRTVIPAQLTTTQSSSEHNTWHVDLKQGNDARLFADGSYKAVVLSSDQSGEIGFYTSRFILKRSPDITIDAPTFGGRALPSLGNINGTAKWLHGGLPVTAVVLQLKRALGDGSVQFWNGVSWSNAGAIDLPTDFKLESDYVGSWKIQLGNKLAVFDDGSYLMVTKALSHGEVVAEASRVVNINRGPQIVILSPTSKGEMSNTRLFQITGSASPGAEGFAISKVFLTLMRPNDSGGYDAWDGLKWTKVPPPVPQLKTELSKPTSSGAVTWLRDQGLPKFSELGPGSYIIAVTAVDASGHRSKEFLNYTVGENREDKQ